jgi:hypothetical protein
MLLPGQLFAVPFQRALSEATGSVFLEYTIL